MSFNKGIPKYVVELLKEENPSTTLALDYEGLTVLRSALDCYTELMDDKTTIEDRVSANILSSLICIEIRALQKQTLQGGIKNG